MGESLDENVQMRKLEQSIKEKAKSWLRFRAVIGNLVPDTHPSKSLYTRPHLLQAMLDGRQNRKRRQQCEQFKAKSSVMELRVRAYFPVMRTAEPRVVSVLISAASSFVHGGKQTMRDTCECWFNKGR